ncbi:DUF5330 domain-containing protein [Pseudohoeflea coraliihabitans]|uniref:DUF5330 domain-containing protein n=1 Tax=Pseudohoeflea coraliihabitans TaxID=2860393 RepID=A0ABS6WSM4_9HYPH|nr:DUF5330 domain-containing protein [Pseudohoeflea sp. DP4N28-3]MBW3098643.1 DUF5330 domain-containing protein [Pseudohoeflea sp. DP4N28-3]
MWFLLKGAFWFSLVLLALPFVAGSPETADRRADAVSTDPMAVPAAPTEVAGDVGQGLAVAAAAIGDIFAMCERNPAICERGGQTLHALGLQAREGARVAYRLLDEHFAAGAEPGEGETLIVAGNGLAAPAGDTTYPGDRPTLVMSEPIVTGSLPAGVPLDRIPVPTLLR